MANHNHKRDQNPNSDVQRPDASKAAETAAQDADETSEIAGMAGSEPANTETEANALTGDPEESQEETAGLPEETLLFAENLTEEPAETDGIAAHGADDTPDPDNPDAIVERFAEELELETELPEKRPADGSEPETAEEAQPSLIGKIRRKLSETELPWKKADSNTQADSAQKTDDTYDPDEDYIFFRPRKKRKKRRRKKSRKLSCTLVLLTLVVSTGVVLAVAILTVAMELFGINKDINEKVVTIPAGASTVSIAEQLKDEHMIQIPYLFRIISRMSGSDGNYIAGEHVLSPSMSYQTMIEELCKNHANEREYVTVTFREGITLLDAANLLEANEVCDADDFLFYFNAGGFGFTFESYLPDTNVMKFYQREGYCFPDTYDFYIDEDPQIVAQKIYANFDSKLTPGDYAKMEELGMTLDEVITLASIVQAEAPFSSSMKMVASVFHNRLINRAVFDKLQSDPTRIYAEDVIHENSPVRNELMEDAYNTYIGQGLPPGAINNPGKDAIEAVLYPADTGYYFFAANVDTGEIFYATTNEEHEANLAEIDRQRAEAAAAAEGD